MKIVASQETPCVYVYLYWIEIFWNTHIQCVMCTSDPTKNWINSQLTSKSHNERTHTITEHTPTSLSFSLFNISPVSNFLSYFLFSLSFSIFLSFPLSFFLLYLCYSCFLSFSHNLNPLLFSIISFFSLSYLPCTSWHLWILSFSFFFLLIHLCLSFLFILFIINSLLFASNSITFNL